MVLHKPPFLEIAIRFVSPQRPVLTLGARSGWCPLLEPAKRASCCEDRGDTEAAPAKDGALNVSPQRMVRALVAPQVAAQIEATQKRAPRFGRTWAQKVW